MKDRWIECHADKNAFPFGQGKPGVKLALDDFAIPGRKVLIRKGCDFHIQDCKGHKIYESLVPMKPGPSLLFVFKPFCAVGKANLWTFMLPDAFSESGRPLRRRQRKGPIPSRLN